MTTETLCVQRELLRVACSGGNEAWQALEELRALLAQPVASEPVAWCFIHQDGSLNDISMTEHSKGMTPLYRHPPAPAIPEGYALVPIEPTPEMISSYLSAQKAKAMSTDMAWGVSNPADNFMAGYAAMLAAVPQPTEGSTDE